MAPPVLRPVSSNPAPARKRRRTLGQILVQDGQLDEADVLRAVMTLTREETQLGHALVINGMITEAQLYAALARQFGAVVADLTVEPPDPRLIDLLGAEACLGPCCPGSASAAA